MDDKKEELIETMADLKFLTKEQPTVTVDFPEVNLKKLIITNDKKIYEKMKNGNGIGILFDPIAFKKAGFNDNDEVYIIGIL